MARSVSVKIPTATVIEMIEQKIAQLKQEDATYPQRLKEYKKEMSNLIGKIVKIAKDNAESDDVRLNGGHYNASITIDSKLLSGIVFPEQPDSPDQYYRKRNLEDLQKTLKLLKLTDQPTVTSSTYNSVLELL